jgi:hypothetical protein
MFFEGTDWYGFGARVEVYVDELQSKGFGDESR